MGIGLCGAMIGTGFCIGLVVNISQRVDQKAKNGNK